MTKERTSNERFEIVGLTKAEADRCMEVLCGGPMPWDRGYCFASSELFARPLTSKREQELEAIVRRLMPATRDVLWCALVWNDHNYEYSDLTDKAKRAATALGYPRGTIGDQIDRVNEFLAHVDSVLSEGKSAAPSNEETK